jgi:hypothetical protein
MGSQVFITVRDAFASFLLGTWWSARAVASTDCGANGTIMCLLGSDKTPLRIPKDSCAEFFGDEASDSDWHGQLMRDEHYSCGVPRYYLVGSRGIASCLFGQLHVCRLRICSICGTAACANDVQTAITWGLPKGSITLLKPHLTRVMVHQLMHMLWFSPFRTKGVIQIYGGHYW